MYFLNCRRVLKNREIVVRQSPSVWGHPLRTVRSAHRENRNSIKNSISKYGITFSYLNVISWFNLCIIIFEILYYCECKTATVSKMLILQLQLYIILKVDLRFI